MYKSGDSQSMHKFTLPPDHPDFIRAKINAQQISDVSLLWLYTLNGLPIASFVIV